MPQHRLGIPLAAWPALDRRLAELAFDAGDVLDGHGLGAKLAEASCRKRRHGYGVWLRFLESHGALDSTALPWARATRDLIARFLAELHDRVSSRSVANYAC